LRRRKADGVGDDQLQLGDEERTGHLPNLVKDLAVRLSRSDSKTSVASLPRKTRCESFSICPRSPLGKRRYSQGYTFRNTMREHGSSDFTLSLRPELEFGRRSRSILFGLRYRWLS
jgi:hypothetical protein